MALAGEDNCVFLETGKAGEDERRSWFFHRPVAELICQAQDDPGDFFRKAEKALKQGYYLAGWFSYEFGCLLEPRLRGLIADKPSPAKSGEPLAWLGVFSAPLVLDHATGRASGPWPEAPEQSEPQTGYQISNLHPNLSEEAYAAAIARIKACIESGDTYQVNFTLKLIFNFSGSPEALYLALRRNQSVAYGAYINQGPRRILSFSPELFFRKNNDTCLVRPMKGTIGRGLIPSEDEGLRAFLEHDEKNRSENVMIVDLLRNDLGRVCEPGGVRVDSLFDIETYETLHQMTSSIRGRLRKGISMAELFSALFPCGSVTGAPKIRTMEIIRELESEPRGVYTGAIGFFTPEGEAVCNVPIRTIKIEDGKGEMGIGSGVIYDSDPGQEWRECLLKGRFLTNPAPDFELIETLLWQPGSGYWLLEEHLARLAASARHLCFFLDMAKAGACLRELARDLAAPTRVRLGLGRNGELKLSATCCPAPAPVNWPLKPSSGELPAVKCSAKSTDPASLWLYHKTTLRELYESERRQALAEGFYEVLFTNTRGELTEGSISNLFVLKGGELLTPPLACGLLPGVFRDYLLNRSSLPAREAVLTQDDLKEAGAIFVGNSVRGLVEVRIQESKQVNIPAAPST